MIFYDFNALSKQIKKLTDKTYTDLVQKKRISQLAGYENISYFHRVF